MKHKEEEHFKVEEIRPEHLKNELKKLSEMDREWLHSKQAQFITTPCPACDSKDYQLYFKKWGFEFQECVQCHTVFISPRPSRDLLKNFYTVSKGYAYNCTHIFPKTNHIRTEKIYKPRLQMCLDICHKHSVSCQSLVEVGSGSGAFALLAKNNELFKKIIVIEPNPVLANECRRKGLNVIEATVEEASINLKTDMVVSFEVIEHLFSPMEFIQASAKMLNPGGLLITTQPNVRGFDMQMLGANHHSFSHAHLNYFHPDSLNLLIRKCGLIPIELITPGRLDAQIVRNALLEKIINFDNQPFFKRLFTEDWDSLGRLFQNFIVNAKMSSHSAIAAYKP
jgi:SAM-dependent methyltransferase